MVFSIHTFELTLTLDSEVMGKIKEKAYKNAKGRHRLFPDEKRSGVLIDTIFKDKGVKIEYHNDTYAKKVKFIVNPSRLLGGHDLELWKPNSKNIDKLLRWLDGLIGAYFGKKYTLNNFKLTRMDFTVNIDVGSRKNVSAYIKILHNIGKVKGFSMKYSKNDEHINRGLSFDLEGNSNGVEFSAYDKEAESKSKKAAGILRVEVRLTTPKAVRKHTEESDTSAQIRDLASNSKDIFMETFERVVPRGIYLQKKEAIKLIEKNVTKKKHREKMLRLLELIPEKKSLLLAQKAMEVRDIDSVMEWFTELGLSPVTIGKRADVKELKSLYKYL